MKGSEPGMHEKIVAMAMNGSGCRETSRVLGNSLNMVLRHFKKLNSLNKASVIDKKNTIIISAVMDEHGLLLVLKRNLDGCSIRMIVSNEKYYVMSLVVAPK